MSILETLFSLIISSLLLFIVGKYFFSDLWSELYRRFQLLIHGKRTIGVVTNAFVSEDSDGTFSFGMDVSFNDQEGIERNFRPDARYSISPFIGRKVDVIYMPSNPDKAELFSYFMVIPPILSLFVIIIACSGIIRGLIKQFS